MKLYGYENGSRVSSATALYSSAVASSNNFKIGLGHNNSFSGLIDEVRVYNRALSSAEVKALYNMGR